MELKLLLQRIEKYDEQKGKSYLEEAVNTVTNAYQQYEEKFDSFEEHLDKYAEDTAELQKELRIYAEKWKSACAKAIGLTVVAVIVIIGVVLAVVALACLKAVSVAIGVIVVGLTACKSIIFYIAEMLVTCYGEYACNREQQAKEEVLNNITGTLKEKIQQVEYEPLLLSELEECKTRIKFAVAELEEKQHSVGYVKELMQKYKN